MANTYTTNYNLAKPANGDVDWHIPINGNFDTIDTTMKTISDKIPSGVILMYGAPTAPTGWLECDGSAVSRTTYSSLFAKIGTTFGEGNGTTTFNLPDLRGEFVRGWDHERGVDAGRELGTGQGDDVKQHTHNFTVTGAAHYQGGYSGPNMVTSNTMGYVSVSPVGGPETRPRNVALMYIIKT
jgi:microcystin-dependent protein